MPIDGLHLLADIPRYWAPKRPDKAATVFEGNIVTWADFDRLTSQVGNGIIEAGVKPQGRVGYLGKNSDLYFQLLFGAAKANAVMVGINWRLAPPEVEYIVNDAGIEVLFVEEEFFGVIGQVREHLAPVRLFVAMSGHGHGWEAYADWRDGQSDQDPRLPADPEDVCVQLYTSGTTGRPKGVQLSHRGFFVQRAADEMAGEWNSWNERDVIMIPMPVFHVGGTGWGFQGFYNGATQVILGQAEPGQIIDTIQEYRVTKVFVVPAVLQFMLQHEKAKTADFSHVRVVLYGASPIPEEVLVKALDTFKCPFVQLYGMTETSGSVTYLPPEVHVPGSTKLRSCGVPFHGVEIIIADGEGNPQPPGQVGEILIRSPAIMKGYWNLPEATAEAVKDGWYHSGDAGYMDEDGYIYVYDRVKDMIVSGGENIYPAEVESALFKHPAVADAAVIGVPSERWGEEVKAVVVREPDTHLTEQELIAFVRTQIAGYKTPKSVDFVETLPRNPSGKLLKKDLREAYWKDQARRVG
ncbi:MAG: long-chain-fatty-acid--CoA ligase [Alphaproteobacteria bacterium]|nr:long-chain-fatty-acid--CoA ligase [Alphaproteobacteria bacterium]